MAKQNQNVKKRKIPSKNNKVYSIEEMEDDGKNLNFRRYYHIKGLSKKEVYAKMTVITHEKFLINEISTGKYKNKGYDKLFMGAIISDASKNKIKDISLYSLKEDKQFFEEFGFVDIGESTNYKNYYIMIKQF